MPLQQGYYLACMYCIKFYCSKVRDPELQGPKMVLFHVTKTVLFGKCPKIIKITKHFKELKDP